MQFEDIKAALQPSIDDDLEALYGAFIQETGEEDVTGFVHLLFEGELIDKATFDAILAGKLAGPKPTPAQRAKTLNAMKVAQLKKEYERLFGKSPGKKKKSDLIEAIIGRELDNEEKAAGAAPGPPPVPAGLGKTATPAPAPPRVGPPTKGGNETFEDEPTAVKIPKSAAADDNEDVDDAPTNASGPPPNLTPSAKSGTAALEDMKADAENENADDMDETPSGTYVMDKEGNNTNPEPDAPKKKRERREGSRTGARTGQRRKARGTGETDTGARKRNSKDRKIRKQKAGGGGAIAGKGYEFIGELGQGAMGAVLKARDLDLNRVVAFKTMSAEIAASPLSSKFIGEAQITAQLEHPNIIPIYGLEATDKGELAYSMKMVRGRTFEDIILECHAICDGKQPMDDGHALTRRLEFFIYVCEAMHYAHRRGVVHRDLKPENIMIGPYDEVYVMDWGISSVFNNDVHQEGEEPVTLTQPPEEEGELIIGTPQYMSPEQAHGRNDELNGYSDQYALGLILYELISLKQAVTGKAPLKIVMRQQDGEKNPLVHYKSGQKIPAELKAIALRACAVETKDRYATVADLGEDIQRYLRGDETRAKPDNVIQKFFRFLNRHKEMTALGVMGGFALLASLVILSLFWSAYQTKVANDRESRIQIINTMIAQQSSIIDGTFIQYEGLLGVAKATATDMLQSGEMSPESIHYSSDWDGEVTPDGTFKSKVYGMDINIDQPAYFLPKGVSEGNVQVSMRRLEPIRRHQKRILLRSKAENKADSPDKQARRLIGDIGVPLAWAHVGLENGLYVGYPGHGGYPEQWDPRERPWYTLAKNKKVPTWGAPYPDYFGLGAILPCATGLYDHDGSFVGTVAVEMTFGYIIDKLLVIDDLFASKIDDDNRAEFLLVDNKGRIVVTSSKKDVKIRGGQLKPRPLRLKDFDYPEIRTAIDKRKSGKDEIGDKMIFYNRLNSLGWYYVVIGDTDVLLDKYAE